MYKYINFRKINIHRHTYYKHVFLKMNNINGLINKEKNAYNVSSGVNVRINWGGFNKTTAVFFI